MAFFPRFSAGDFTPLFRLLDDYDTHRSSRPRSNFPSVHSFAPKFDVRELKDGYRLDGELPGVSQKDIEIEFTDPHTLVVRGRAEREYNDTNVDESQPQIEKAADDASSSKCYQPTVEDEDEASDSAVTAPAKPTEKQVSKDKSEPAYRYWVTERSVGEFHRTFTFPMRVDQDAVKASLKNGILSIVVPKAQAPSTRKITIE
ncbi:hypothetical protein VTN00DRAFT_8552 [Thermoascus crustaceus]|uniref:uncharacterized protein n=1 Tax=Thermoascus crustaceus TaxID=5088 RepID=UPI0037438D19